MSKSPISVCFYCADQNTHRDRSRGISTYTQGLMSHLLEIKDLKLSAVISKSSIDVPAGIEKITLPLRSDHMLGRLAADHLHPLSLRSHRPDIWHYPKGFLPVGSSVRGKKIGTVADVMIQFDADQHPESRSSLAWRYWIGLLKHSIANLDLIITVSEFSKRAILEFCQRYQLKCPPISVTYQGVTVIRPSPVKFAEKGDYVVHLASPLPYKGTRWLLQQWRELSGSVGDLPELGLVGSLDPQATEVFSHLNHATLIAPVPRPELEEMISKSRALLLPSEIEGFGIPAVEGYLLGTPVMYAKGTALEEIVGFGSPGGFDRTADSLGEALRAALAMDELTIQQKAADLRQRYDWDDCVRRTLEAYEMALDL